MVFPADALLGDAGRAAGLEDVEGLAVKCFRDEALVLFVSQPFVLEVREAQDVVEAFDLRRGVPAGGLLPVEPERASRVRRKVPLNDLADVRIQALASG